MMVLRVASLLALLSLPACGFGFFLQQYTVEWPNASNDVRAWGNIAMDHASKTWHGKGTIEIEPTLLDDATAARDAFLAEGYVAAARTTSHSPPRDIASERRAIRDHRGMG
jgi:hypothetical protein